MAQKVFWLLLLLLLLLPPPPQGLLLRVPAVLLLELVVGVGSDLGKLAKPSYLVALE